MSTREPLIYPMPEGYELGVLVQQIAEQDAPRAIILDFLQRTILVHPPAEDGIERSEFTVDSLAFLLTSVELEHTDLSLEGALTEFATDTNQLWVCAHPDLKDVLTHDGEILWTKIVERDYLLLVTRSSDQTWRVIGMSHNLLKQDT